MESGRHLLSAADRESPYNLWKPREEFEAYLFQCQLRNGFISDADEDNWMFLGFCTVRDDHDTQRLTHYTEYSSAGANLKSSGGPWYGLEWLIC